MESHGVLGPPEQISHIYSYQTAESFCIAIQLRPPYETGRPARHIHKITSEWDYRKGVDELTPHDMMISFTERGIQVAKRGGQSNWTYIRGLKGSTLQQLNREKCFWTMTKHGGRYWLISVELVKKTPGKLWSRLMRDEREANRPGMKWDKDMQRTPMILDRNGKAQPSTYCHPMEKPKYEQEGDDLDLVVEEVCAIEDRQFLKVHAKDLVDPRFGMEESTHAMVVSMVLNPTEWRELQRDRGSDCDPFGLDIPFGGMHINFYLKGDEESPILEGDLGGAVWRRGARWSVEQKGGRTMLELYLPKQTPEPWSYVVEGHHSLSRVGFDAYNQMILDGLWDDEAIDEKAKGDDHFRNSEYRAAVTCYDRVLERNPDSYKTLTNRAAANLAFETEKMRLETVLEDAQRALEINPMWFKAKFREGTCLAKLHRYEEAIWSLEEGQRMDKSGNPEWEDEIRKVHEDRIAWANRKKPSYLNDVE